MEQIYVDSSFARTFTCPPIRGAWMTVNLKYINNINKFISFTINLGVSFINYNDFIYIYTTHILIFLIDRKIAGTAPNEETRTSNSRGNGEIFS
jgi:hypothetical protein